MRTLKLEVIDVAPEEQRVLMVYDQQWQSDDQVRAYPQQHELEPRRRYDETRDAKAVRRELFRPPPPGGPPGVSDPHGVGNSTSSPSAAGATPTLRDCGGIGPAAWPAAPILPTRRDLDNRHRPPMTSRSKTGADSI